MRTIAMASVAALRGARCVSVRGVRPPSALRGARPVALVALRSTSDVHDNTHAAWSESDDWILWEHRNEDLEDVASLLGRKVRSAAGPRKGARSSLDLECAAMACVKRPARERPLETLRRD